MANADESRSICLTCAAELPPDRHFCPQCGAPSDAFAVTAPFETIQSRGWSYRAAQKPQNALVVIGVWLIWLPTLVLSLLGLVAFVGGIIGMLHRGHFGSTSERFALVLMLIFGSIGCYVASTNLWRSTSFYLRRYRDLGPVDAEVDGDDFESDGNDAN